MTNTKHLSGLLVLPDGVQAGAVQFGATLQHIAPQDASTTQQASSERYILPGFIDTHVHGGGGGDTMDGPGGLQQMARLHAQHGTTSMLPTTITNPWDKVLAALRAVRGAMETPIVGGAAILGAHLEGPFISPQQLGAQPPNTLEPTPELLAEVLNLGVVRAVTLAPEQAGAQQAALAFARAGVRVGIGHTRATGEEVAATLEAIYAAGGQSCATHLYNAMGGVEGRNPGPAGALMADPHAWLEVIYDTVHVSPISFRLAQAAAPGRVVLITDAMRAAGLPDGPSELGGQAVEVKNGKATLPDGTLAGSVLTLDLALRHALAAGLDLTTVSQMLSRNPARSLGLSDRGELITGQRADIVVLNTQFEVQEVYVAGERVI